MTEKIGILAIGHGSKLPYNKEVVSQIADFIAQKHNDVVVRAGFMENSEPTLEEAIAGFSGTGVTKIAAVPVFLASGVFGLCVLNSEINEPLLPMLTGLFGSSLLFLSIKNKTKIPEQTISNPEKIRKKSILSSIIASPLCGFLSGLGSGQAAVLGNLFSKTDREGFLTLIGATNILAMGFSFISLYAISKTRTGAAAAVKEIIGSLSLNLIILIIIAILISGIISFFLTKFLAKFLSKKIHKINYTKISIATLIFLTIVVFLVSSFEGIFVLISSTLLGIFCNKLNVKKTNMMGCLLLPTIIYYFPF